jgi:hypothetical protein
MRASVLVLGLLIASPVTGQSVNKVSRSTAPQVNRATSPRWVQPLITDTSGQICLVRKKTRERVCKSRAAWREVAAAMPQ